MNAPAADAATEAAFWRSEWVIERGDVRLDGAAFAAGGRNRRSHGDAYLVNPAAGLLAITDGVSSLPNSGPTARRCLKELNLELEGADAWDAGALRGAIDMINRRMFAAARSTRSPERLGACILVGAALWPAGDGLTYFHVGDGALILRRDAEASFEAVTQPQVVRRASKLDPGRDLERLAAAIGVRPTVNPDLGECELGRGGAFILASDGVRDLHALSAAPWFNGDDDTDALEARVRGLAERASDDLTIIAGRRAPVG